jgi:hypothetical protein
MMPLLLTSIGSRIKQVLPLLLHRPKDAMKREAQLKIAAAEYLSETSFIKTNLR